MKVSPILLFITNRDDFTSDFLIYKIQDKMLPYLRINSDDIANFCICYKPNDKITISFLSQEYSLDEVRSVYFRRAPTVFPTTINSNDANYVNRERKEFFEGLYLGLNAKWINPLFSTYIAERKLFQLKVAEKIGLKIPKTIVSNSPSIVLDFIKENKNGCIIKPISHGLQITNEGGFSIYTSEISACHISLKGNALFESPVLVQEKIRNYRDIRVVVIGKDTFPVEIIKYDSTSIDWRDPNIKKKYHTHEISNELITKILDLNKELHLIYSAIDFILTPEGKYVFLEINPAGEWVWLERELNLPLSSRFIQELLNED